MRGRHVPVLAGAAFGLSMLLAATANAETGTVSAQYQGYSTTAGSQDPYAASNPQDVHVSGYGGQPVVTGDILFNLDTLPAGSTINDLTLTLTPNASQSDNVNASAANIEACVLTTPLTSNGYQSTPPTYDCTKAHAAGALALDGNWQFDIGPLVSYWATAGNTGLALVADDAPAVTQLPVAPTAWSIGFDHTKTTASVDYAPGSPASLGVPPGSASGGSTSSLPHVAPAPAFVAPAPLTATVPSASPTKAASPGTVTSSPPTSGTVGPRVTPQWIWLCVGLGATALLLLIVGASQQVLRTGRLSIGAVGAAFARSRSQLATPVATLALASVLALGFSGQLVGVAGAAGGGGGGTASSSTGDGTGTVSPGAGSTAAAAPSGGVAQGGGASGTKHVAGTPASANTNGGSNGPGVTATTVRIGFVYTTNSQAANQAFGFKVASTGDQEAEQKALVSYVNTHGGIGGRQIDPIYAAVDVSKAETDINVYTEVCKSLTEDYHVFAVVAGGGPDAADTCYAQHGTLNFDAGYSAPDLAFLRSTSPYIWADELAALDRAMTWEVAGLRSRGYFGGGATNKVGVVVASDGANTRVYQNVTQPAIEAAGVTPFPFSVRYDSVSSLANDTKQAVVQFQARGINHVIFQGGGSGGGGSFAILFMIDAESQHYNPTYGLGSADAPVALASQVPQDQLQGALAVGELPVLDTDDTHYAAWPSTATEKQCASIESAAGNSFTSREGALAILTYCDNVFELQQGAAGLTTLNAQLWANNVMKLGSGVFNDTMYSAYVGSNHWDAAGGYRLLHAVQNCEGTSACFVYDNGTLHTS